MNEAAAHSAPLITNDAVILGLLMGILALVFVTSHSANPRWKRFYTIFPSLLLCYFLPSLLTLFGIIDPDTSNLYFVSSRYLLPASLVLLTLSVDLRAIAGLGSKAVILFFTGTLGILIGGPLAVLLVGTISPETIGADGPDAVWRGLTTVAGSWIGGGANQTAMKEIFEVGDEIFSALIAVDVIVANIWMAVLLYAAGRSKEIDARTGADTSAIEVVKEKVEAYRAQVSRIPNLTDLMVLLAVAFGVTALGHAVADLLAPWLHEVAPVLDRYSLTSKFFWLVVVATTGGLFLSFTKARQLEGVGASRVGSAFLYVLVASIGMKMDLTAILRHTEMFVIGLVWMAFHATLMILVARWIKAPVFFMAVGSQANVGGAASAPIVASAFHPSLAPVGVLLAVLGYVVGTYAAYACGLLMRAASLNVVG
ncbi:MAG: DUF819 family protein [Acidobacteriota bacterium]